MPSDIVQELVNKTYQELAAAAKPAPRSRIGNTTNGYIFLVGWANASLLRRLVRTYTETLPRSEYRLKAQVDDAARSVVANIEEGYRRPTTAEYLTFLGYSQASLEEVKGDIRRAAQDGLLASVAGSSLAGLGIDLARWHEALKKSVISKPSDKLLQSPLRSFRGTYRNVEEFKQQPQHVYTAVAAPAPQPPATSLPNKSFQTPVNSFKFLYPPVDDLRAQAQTYEIFIELVNKTDWHLRRLVVSLEDKLNRDQKFYQVEQARIRSKLKMK